MILNKYKSCTQCTTNIATRAIDHEFFCDVCYCKKYAHLLDSDNFNLVSEPVYYDIGGFDYGPVKT